ncbi:hypothetical protein BDV28DRAFT_27590 [Aspergillus coremiiformis]|uniref:Cupin 2 conserved barrel domain-containing protein n=1 Tax=Aspergillus coremiiformis TaxID=138285 RepID=A0A5N6ZED0_9EURO|nr:hypothetical protein BDV28DRAFT_27590 [Aspergillus coremiiformis]
MSQSIASPLPPPRRVVTGHNANGQSTVTFDSQLTPHTFGDHSNLTMIWSTTEHPADVNSPQDGALLTSGVPPKGVGMTVYDLPPKTEGVFHRSITLDYVIVGKGSVVLGLDDGSKVALTEGDVVIQRATMHSWSNPSDQWTRLYGHMMVSQAPIVNGKELEADWPF